MNWGPTSQIKISLVDDQKIIRELLSRALGTIPEFNFIETYSDGIAFLEHLNAYPEKKPDIAIIDVDMPVMSGEELNERLQVEYPEIKVLVLSMHIDAVTIAKMINAGVASYLPKDCAISELLWAINSVFRTGSYLNSEVVDKLRENNEKTRKIVNSDGITQREAEVLELICQEYTNADIAEKLNVSVRTVDTHRKRLLFKAGCKNTAGLVLYAMKNNLISLQL
ncbi:response regulator [Desertivirga arenae]|uniref:response regulator n=1 Tax=Desertivirga arenae TaxID=2810309 RepID=UPI001A956DA3|nr:response regulator transcription factor [Pedobacter sp. SYSU D00823]